MTSQSVTELIRFNVNSSGRTDVMLNCPITPIKYIKIKQIVYSDQDAIFAAGTYGYITSSLCPNGGILGVINLGTAAQTAISSNSEIIHTFREGTVVNGLYSFTINLANGVQASGFDGYCWVNIIVEYNSGL